MTAGPNGSNEVIKKLASRNRGGQPGNTNALKHGFYTKNFSPAECRDLQAINADVLSDEIALLRVLIKRFADQIQASQGIALPESAHYLAVVSEAMVRLASLLRTDHMLGGSESSTFLKEFNETLSRISAEIIEEPALPNTNNLLSAAS